MKSIQWTFVVLLVAALSLAGCESKPDSASAMTGTPVVWNIDAVHSTVHFGIQHMGAGRFVGNFAAFNGVYSEYPGGGALVEAKVDVNSVDSGNVNRDAHLRNSDFFDVETFPAASFRSTSVTRRGQTMKITGDLTLHGVTRSIVIEGTMGSEVPNPKDVRRGFSGTTTFRRSDFGMTWNKEIAPGLLSLGDEVTLWIDLELVKGQ